MNYLVKAMILKNNFAGSISLDGIDRDLSAKYQKNMFFDRS